MPELEAQLKTAALTEDQLQQLQRTEEGINQNNQQGPMVYLLAMTRK